MVCLSLSTHTAAKVTSSRIEGDIFKGEVDSHLVACADHVHCLRVCGVSLTSQKSHLSRHMDVELANVRVRYSMGGTALCLIRRCSTMEEYQSEVCVSVYQGLP